MALSLFYSTSVLAPTGIPMISMLLPSVLTLMSREGHVPMLKAPRAAIWDCVRGTKIGAEGMDGHKYIKFRSSNNLGEIA